MPGLTHIFPFLQTKQSFKSLTYLVPRLVLQQNLPLISTTVGYSWKTFYSIVSSRTIPAIKGYVDSTI